MTFARKAALSGATVVTLLAACSSPALASPPGGTAAPTATQAGGSEFGVPVRAPEPTRPVVSELIVPRTAPAGKPPQVSLRIDERGVGTVRATVTVTDLSTRRTAIVIPLGWVRTGRRTAVSWPRGSSLKAGSYHVSVSARDHHFGTLLRRAHSSGVATLTVLAAPAPAPTSPAPSTPRPETPETVGVATPAQSVAAGAVFPVAGAHDFGGPEGRFGAPRSGHVHQGQDVLTAEGTPIVAPLAGTILTASYQAGAAGYYAVEHTDAGLDFMFAHCQAGSLLVVKGDSVSAGQTLCRAGQTGDANTPHLHFEIWVGGWQALGGHPIDPLPYLEAWEHGRAAG
jgi:biotin carboxyl carrier protein